MANIHSNSIMQLLFIIWISLFSGQAQVFAKSVGSVNRFVDLTIKANHWPVRVTYGDHIYFSVTTKNIGTVRSGAFRDEFMYNGTRYYHNFDNLEPGQEVTYSYGPFTVVCGINTVSAMTDEQWQTSDINRGNNGTGIYKSWPFYSSQCGTEQPFAASTSYEMNPDINEETVVWVQSTPQNLGYFGSLQVFNFRSGEEWNVPKVTMGAFPKISNRYIVWQDKRDGEFWQIFAYDLITGHETQITSEKTDHLHPSISGDWIVYLDYLGTQSQPQYVAYNLESRQKIRLSNSTALSSENFAAISGKIVLWPDSRNEQWQIWMFDLSRPEIGEKLFVQSPSYFPRISGNLAVWVDWRTSQPQIFSYDFETNREHQITFNSDAIDKRDLVINGKVVIWQDARNNTAWGDLYAYDFSSGLERRISSQSLLGRNNPTFSNDKVIWWDLRNLNADLFMLMFNTEISKTNAALGPKPIKTLRK